MDSILMVNKFYYIRGGAERYMFGLSAELEAQGIEVVPFSMKGANNLPTKYEEYFVPEVSYDHNTPVMKRALSGFASVYSPIARQRITKLVDAVNPVLAHVHNFNHQLTPSILYALKNRGVPVVQTLHDSNIVCPNHSLYDYEKQQLCEACKGHHYVNAIKNKCIKSGYIPSFLGALESSIYHWLRTYESHIDLFISPSQFLKDKVQEFGVDPTKVVVIPNFVDTNYWEQSKTNQGYLLYFGRLSSEKGIIPLVEAMGSAPNLQLNIVGTGPQEDEVRMTVERLKLNNVSLLGFKSGDELRRIVANSLAVVIPSRWYENCPVSILEAYSSGKPVIASALGGIPEMVRHGETGLLFSPYDSDQLRNVLQYVDSHRGGMVKMGFNSRNLAEDYYNARRHMQSILEVYERIL